jgi:hypothetical protein
LEFNTKRIGPGEWSHEGELVPEIEERIGPGEWSHEGEFVLEIEQRRIAGFHDEWKDFDSYQESRCLAAISKDDLDSCMLSICFQLSCGLSRSMW